MSTKMDQYELVDLLTEAQEKIFKAIENLKTYVRETGDTNAKAYLVDHLEIMVSEQHGFLSRDINIDTLIERVQSGEFDEDEDDGLWDEDNVDSLNDYMGQG